MFLLNLFEKEWYEERVFLRIFWIALRGSHEAPNNNFRTIITDFLAIIWRLWCLPRGMRAYDIPVAVKVLLVSWICYSDCPYFSIWYRFSGLFTLGSPAAQSVRQKILPFDWLICDWVRDLTVPMHLGLSWRTLCAPYLFMRALLFC